MGGGAEVDALFAEALCAGESVPAIRDLLARRAPGDEALEELLRRPVPVRMLEHVALTAPWSDRPLLLASVALNPRAPRHLVLRLLPALYWRSLAQVAMSPRADAAARARAEALLKDKLGEMRLGERVTLARIATSPVLAALLHDADPKVAEACLQNPRLREADLLLAMRADAPSPALIAALAESTSWSERYALRLALVLQPRTSLPIALGQLTSLLDADLDRVANAAGLHPLLQISAQRLLDRRRGETSRGSKT